MTDDDRKELDEHMNALHALEDVTVSRTRNAAWDTAWADAVRCANGIIEREAAKE